MSGGLVAHASGVPRRARSRDFRRRLLPVKKLLALPGRRAYHWAKMRQNKEDISFRTTQRPSAVRRHPSRVGLSEGQSGTILRP